MAFKVNYRGLEVICDSFADLDALADHLKNGNAVKSIEREPSGNSNAPAGDPFAAFTKNLDKLQRRLINTLLSASGSLTDVELRNAIGLENNNQLAGYTAGVTRAAKKAGLRKEDVLDATTLSNKPGARSYSYAIPSKSKEKIRAAM